MKRIRTAAGLCLALLFLVLGIGAQPALAHVSRQHAELVVATGDNVTSGRLIVHRDLVSPEQAGAWANRLLAVAARPPDPAFPATTAGCPAGS